MSLIETGKRLGLTNLNIHGCSIDSRSVKPGDLFFALKGERSDGHDYLKEVAAQGGIAAVVESGFRGETGGLQLIRVDGVVQTMQQLAKEKQARQKQRIIGVTGSAGKTTTKEFIATLLTQKFSVTKTEGNQNSQVGLPLAILNNPGEAEFFVVEMAMDLPGQILRLIDIAPPEVAVITNIGHQHQKNFPTGIEGIAAAKAEILSHPKTQAAVINAKALQYRSVLKMGSCQKYTFATAPDQADFILEQGWIVQQGDDWSPTIRLPFSETHFCEDFIAAAAVARVVGLSWKEIVQGAAQIKSIGRRFEKIERDGILFVNDCYNADPETMQSAIRNLPLPSFGGKTIGVFGDMTELGSYAEQGHREVAGTAIGKIDHLLCLGKGCLPMIETFTAGGKPADLYRDLKALKNALFEIAKIGDVVLIKGSNGHKLWQILED